MASLAFDQRVTLAPFRKVYGGRRDAVLLADDFFGFSEWQTEKVPREEPEAITPKVISEPDRAHFEAAVAQWFTDSEFDSLPDEMKEHESFQEIISYGVAVAPLIAANLRRKPSFLFLALEEILEDDPVPEEAYGNLQTVVAAWLRWLQR